MPYPPTDDRLRHLLAQRINPHVDTWRLAFFIAGSIVDDPAIRAELDRIAAVHAAGQPCGDRHCRACFTASVGPASIRPREQIAEAPAATTTDRAAILREAAELAGETPAACPGYETAPNRCACPCEGCTHNCGAHQEGETPATTPETPADPDDRPCGCGHPRARHMGDQHERGCHACWDLPGNDGWAHAFVPRGTQPAVSAVVGRADDTTHTEALACEGFQWIGQSFATCDRCGRPAWEHQGMDVAVERAGLFDTRRTVRPWEPGEADRIRAKWGTPADRPAAGARQDGAQTQEADRNTGPGWYEVINPRNATTNIALVYEDGSLYLPEGDALTADEFAFAAAGGKAHRLVRADEERQP